jgi:serine/threonine protein kinase
VKLNEAFDLLERLLELDPVKRISAREAYCYPFLGGHCTSIDNVITMEKAIELR